MKYLLHEHVARQMYPQIENCHSTSCYYICLLENPLIHFIPALSLPISSLFVQRCSIRVSVYCLGKSYLCIHKLYCCVILDTSQVIYQVTHFKQLYFTCTAFLSCHWLFLSTSQVINKGTGFTNLYIFKPTLYFILAVHLSSKYQVNLFLSLQKQYTFGKN